MAYCHERKFWEQSTGQKTRKKDKTSGGSRGGARGARPPPPTHYFSTKMRPEGPKKIFLETGSSPLSQGLDDRPPPLPPPLSEGLDPPLKTTSKVTGID